ncbi:hypothetical protein [Shewanella putrefaciens]|uniref:hypothetical protein n=1 Tax=Shewanella putrefaciens TaxID=24 RepID=UPI0018E8E495|nr:hypothetical protein [Shewanella putrefaciens]
MTPLAQSHLSKLLCGNLYTENTGEIDEIFLHISETIDKLSIEIQNFLELSADRRMLFGPFLGRSILELGTTALIARLDPFRVLLLRGKQKQADYAIDKPHKSSIRWQGDVMASKVKELWDDKNLDNPTRALLGDYITNIVLEKSVTSVLDSSTEEKLGPWYNKIQSYEEGTVILRIRDGYSRLFSSLSKGVHHEMVVPIGAAYDDNTVNSLINDVLYYLSSLALIVSFVPFAYNRTGEDAFESFKNVQTLEITHGA